MSVNSTSSFDDLVYFCSKSESAMSISVGMLAAKTVLVLPLSVFVLYLGHRQWRQQRSFSHSDVFTHHLALMEMFWPLGLICIYWGKHLRILAPVLLGMSALSLTLFGELMFHLLICVEWYLAVVHPVVYLTLRNSRGVWIRTISARCVWLACFALCSLHVEPSAAYVTIALLFVLAVTISATSFCCFSALWVLGRPGPGEGGGEKVGQSKLRTCHTIIAITSVLWVWFLGLFLTNALSQSSLLSEDIACMLTASANWLNLPNSLVAPFLYLQRAVKPSWSCLNNM